jgi:excisionase family DNA binding protein
MQPTPGFPCTQGARLSYGTGKVHKERTMVAEKDEVFTTKEACKYLRISRPTFLKLVHSEQIKAKKVGKGWKVLKSELQAYLQRAED